MKELRDLVRSLEVNLKASLNKPNDEDQRYNASDMETEAVSRDSYTRHLKRSRPNNDLLELEINWASLPQKMPNPAALASPAVFSSTVGANGFQQNPFQIVVTSRTANLIPGSLTKTQMNTKPATPQP